MNDIIIVVIKTILAPILTTYILSKMKLKMGKKKVAHRPPKKK